MRQCLALVRAALLALVVLLVTAGFLGMHMLAAPAAHAPASAGAPMERTTAAHAHAGGLVVGGPDGMGAGGMGSDGMDSGRMGAGATSDAGHPGTPAGACHGGCPPSGVAHATDCMPAPGAPAPVPPAAVVLARSDAAPTGSPDAPPASVATARAPSLTTLSISRT